ncbi:testis-expressed protein 38 [Hemicordylus capensis]|uniref:testis-expressed protein 38 n=1 Tax=Hemicordylus capensis TaxID=884348 RepID=UPI002303F584|nr:testis-expressed protein 38 [Hemicordylus capensis]XP_053099914.1 testis-expressed protein 38 [Hemicordylus capensis]
MIISSGLLPIYFGSLGLCYILVFSCMLLLQWRKRIQRERRAKAWMERMKMEWFFYRALAHWADKDTQPGIQADICNLESDSIPKPQGSFLSSEITTESSTDSFPSLPAEPYIPVFQEVPCACALSHLPPLLEHSASYPCSSIPAKSTPFNSPLKFAMLKNESYHDGSSISA